MAYKAVDNIIIENARILKARSRNTIVRALAISA